MDGSMPVVDQRKCQRCGLCVSICQCGILVMEDDGVRIVGNVNCGRCTRWCNTCELVCPNGAITCPFEVCSENEPK